MKKYIKISTKFNDKWNNLSRNQILLVLVNFANEKELSLYFVNKYYYYNKYRLEKDKNNIIEYSDIFDEMRNYDGTSKLEYNKIKYSTLKLIIDEGLNKKELLIILYFIDLYRNNFNRTYNLHISRTLNKIFKEENVRQNKKIFLDTLEKLKNWKYNDGSKFIKDYKINDKYVQIFLDKGKKTW